MAQTNATVEVLTAEVRALMVGSRQVTLSVYRQLDTVEPDDLEPFGRVRDGHDGPGIWLIGRRLDDGALVRAVRTWPDQQTPPPAWFHWSSHKHSNAEIYKRFLVMGTDEAGVYWPAALSSTFNERCEKKWINGHYGQVWRDAFCVDVDLDALRAEWAEIAQDQWIDRSESIAVYRSAEALPLIVLAGLR